MASPLTADRSVRDKQLAVAMVLLICAQVLHLVADSIRLAISLESRSVNGADQAASWLIVIANLPLLAAASLGLVSFLAGRGEWKRWLRWGLLLAAFSYAIVFISSVVEFAALESSPPDGTKLALLAAALGAFALAAGFLLAGSVFAKEGEEQATARDRRLRWAARVLGAALLLGGLSAWAYVRVYSGYGHHGQFSNGLMIEGFGAFAAGLSLFYAAGAFGSGRSRAAGSGRPRRERRLFLGAVALGLSFLLVGLGEAERAAGTTALGYPESIAIAGWIFVLFRGFEAAAVFFAGRGLRAAAATRQE